MAGKLPLSYDTGPAGWGRQGRKAQWPVLASKCRSVDVDGRVACGQHLLESAGDPTWFCYVSAGCLLGRGQAAGWRQRAGSLQGACRGVPG